VAPIGRGRAVSEVTFLRQSNFDRKAAVPIRICVLGAPDLCLEAPRGLSRRLSRLLGYLVVRRGSFVSSAVLIDWLWQGDPPKSAQSALRVHMTRLRAELGDKESIVVSPGSGYRIDLTKFELDLDVFEEELLLAEEARRRHDIGNAIAHLSAGLALWRGGPFDGCEDSAVAAAERARLEQVRRQAQLSMFEWMVASGEAEKALPDLQAAVTENPGDELFARLLMRALERIGCTAGALRIFEETETWLRYELGIGPSAELQDLAGHIARREQPIEAPLGAGTW